MMQFILSRPDRLRDRDDNRFGSLRFSGHGPGRTRASIACLALIAAGSLRAVDAPWRHEYSGTAATGPNVIALWQFDKGAETADQSGRGHALKLRGQARFVVAGKFGGALESFPADAAHDHAQGAETPSRPDLTPKGAFTIEMWLRPKPEMARHPLLSCWTRNTSITPKTYPAPTWIIAFTSAVPAQVNGG